MKHNKYILPLAAVVLSLGFGSCMDYGVDDPVSTLSYNQVALDDEVYHGTAEILNYDVNITEAGFDKALNNLQTYLRQAKGGQYALRGGKEGNYPGEHAYQRQYSLGPDNYAQYTTVPHYDFMYGTLQSTYDISAEFNPDPNSMYLMVKNAIVPMLHTEPTSSRCRTATFSAPARSTSKKELSTISPQANRLKFIGNLSRFVV